MTAERAALPDWPRLMGIDLAAEYLGIGETTFRALGIVPIHIGRRQVWDRQSLDLFADRLAGQPLNDEERKRASHDVERSFLESRRHA